MNFNTVTEFENQISEFFGAPYAVAVDSCTHGVEICLRHTQAKSINVPKNTYLSIPFLAHKLWIELKWKDENWVDYYYLTDKVDMELRKYYYGGRNEIFNKLGETTGKLYYVDFTSLYPYVMNKYKYPTGQINIIESPLLENINSYFGFIEC